MLLLYTQTVPFNDFISEETMHQLIVSAFEELAEVASLTEDMCDEIFENKNSHEPEELALAIRWVANQLRGMSIIELDARIKHLDSVMADIPDQTVHENPEVNRFRDQARDSAWRAEEVFKNVGIPLLPDMRDRYTSMLHFEDFLQDVTTVLEVLEPDLMIG